MFSEPCDLEEMSVRVVRPRPVRYSNDEKPGVYKTFKELFNIPDSDFATGRFIEGKIFGHGNEFVRHAISKHFNSAISGVSFSAVKLNKLISELKSFGEVSHVYSLNYVDTLPNSTVVKLNPFSQPDSEIFLHIDEIRYYTPRDDHPNLMDFNDSDLVDDKFGLVNQLWIFFKPANSLAYDLSNNINKSSKILRREEDVYIDMIVAGQHGLQLKSINLETPKSLDLGLHYGELFPSYHEKLLERIKSKSKGIVMLHGPPGTGKTHYIRNIIPKIIEMGKRVVIIPKHVINQLESPHFNSFMIDNFTESDTVFIIEDAESIISKRDAAGGHRSELVSTILNITDGILNDIFNIQVILTFNTELTSIDEALLRKGRLISKYEFGNLSKDQAKKLAESIKVDFFGGKSEYSLAEIYAMGEREEDEILINQNITKPKSFVGF